MFWGYGKDYGAADVKAAFEAGRAAGVNSFDTAKISGLGPSEWLLGQFAQASGYWPESV